MCVAVHLRCKEGHARAIGVLHTNLTCAHTCFARRAQCVFLRALCPSGKAHARRCTATGMLPCVPLRGNYGARRGTCLDKKMHGFLHLKGAQRCTATQTFAPTCPEGSPKHFWCLSTCLDTAVDARV